MSSLTETILVCAVVGVAAFWAIRAIWNAVRKGNICTSCSSSGSCPAVDKPEILQELTQIDQCGPRSFECPANSDKSPQDKAKT